jgi:hypothetical protein
MAQLDLPDSTNALATRFPASIIPEVAATALSAPIAQE